jgi:hypothetical protein
MRALATMTGSQHGHDGVVGSDHVRGAHLVAHQLMGRLGQITYITAPHRLRGSRDPEPFPREDVFQPIERR